MTTRRIGDTLATAMAAPVEPSPGPRTALAVTVALALSIGLHVVAYGAIPGLAWLAAHPPTVDSLDVEIVAPKPEPKPEPDPVPAKVGQEEPPPQPPPVARSEPPPPPKASPRAPHPPAQQAPVPFNVTMTNQGGDSSWAVEANDGKSSDAPAAAPGRVTGSDQGVAGGTPGGTGPSDAPVAAGDLSRAPKPPPQKLADAILRRYYPADAKAQGIEGKAMIRLLIRPDGSAKPLNAISVDPPGHKFAKQCLVAVRHMPFTPGYDKLGRPVPTVNTFRCTFTVQ